MDDEATSTLTHMRCVACRKGEPTLSDDEIEGVGDQIPDWEVMEAEGVKRVTRVFTFPDFIQALGFTDGVGALAEQEGHHPALLTEWDRVTVSWWMHKVGGLHRNDLIMAAKTDELYRP